MTFDRLQQTVIELGVGQAWPACPEHGYHPLRATVEGWACSLADNWPAGVTLLARSSAPVWAYGSFQDGRGLGSLLRGDHVIRWYRSDWGWGIIADLEGDVWFHINRFREPAPACIADGASVDYELDGSQGPLRSVRRDSLVLFSEPDA